MIWRKVIFEGVKYDGQRIHGSVNLRSFFFREKRIKLELKKIVFAETGIILKSVEILSFKYRGFYEMQNHEYRD